MSKHQNLFFRTFLYSSLIILISLIWYFANIPIISNYLHDIELKTYDLQFITRHNLNLDPKPPKNILIVGIDAGSINKVGVPWPWPRQFHASLVDALIQAKAKLIIFDIIFDTISPLSAQTEDVSGTETIAMTSFDAGKDDDDIFAASIKNAMNVFLACEAEPISKTEYQTILPINTYLKALNNDISFLGNSAVTYDNDSFVRKAKIIYPEFYKDPAITGSTAFRAAQKYLNLRATILSNNSIKFGKNKVPKEFLINFYGPSETIKTIPYWKALELISSDQTSDFKDKIILIGRTKLKASIDPFKSVRSPDSFPTPYSALTPNFSGVELQATILSNLIENSFITKASNFLIILIFLVFALISCLIISNLRQRLVLCFYLCSSLSIIYIVISFLLFVSFRISIPPTFATYGVILPIYFINLLDQYFIVDKARRRQAKIFRQLVPSQVADEIERMDQDELALGGSKRIITVLFTDIKNFTGLCERNSPETIVNILNQFFTEMVKIIHKHNGLVDKFIGDAIMAIWGSPKVLEKESQAMLATTCALSMSRELASLNSLWERMGMVETLNIRVGINTDYAVTGNIGSVQRMQFSAVGDGVNVASRLEAVNKVYGTNILLSSNTAKLLDKSQTLREVDTVIVPGKDIPLDIYELLDPNNYNQDLISKYSTALSHYRNKNFDGAIKYWEECLRLDKKDKASMVMLERSIKFKQLELNSKLPEDWKPIWIVENK